MNVMQLSFAAIEAAVPGGLPSPRSTRVGDGAKIGEGATGEVFRGELTLAPGGVPQRVAIKVITVPPDALQGVVDAARRTFDREIAVLAAYRHTNLVRLHAVSADAASGRRFALVYELMEGGSLAERLRAPPARGHAGGGGSPAVPVPAAAGAGAPPLTPLQRIDIAMGVARGLAYLHGLREAGDEGAAGPALHRDVKSANVGLTATCVPRLLDFGVAKALGASGAASGGGGGGGGDGWSFNRVTGGTMVGTPGYAAPEVASGQYDVRSEVFSAGVVLLELLTGERVGPSTAREVRRAGVPALAARADASGGAWPGDSAAAVAELVFDCVHHDELDRPGTIRDVLARFAAVRAGMAMGMAVDALRPCVVCGDAFPQSQGVACGAGHFTCREDLHGYAAEEAQAAALAGGVRCPWRGAVGAGVAEQCAAPPWSLDDAAFVDAAGGAVIAALTRGVLHAMAQLREEAARLRPEAERGRAAAAAAAVAEAAAQRGAREQRVAAVRAAILAAHPPGPGEGGVLACPRCRFPFVDYESCAALVCGTRRTPGGCGAHFSPLCLSAFPTSRDVHAHLRQPAHPGVGDGYNVSVEQFGAYHAAQRLRAMTAAVEAAADGDADFGRELRAALWPAPATVERDVDDAVNWHDAVAVVAELTARGADAVAAARCCTALANICAGSYAHREAVVAANGVPAIVAALEAHRGDVDITAAACIALHMIGGHGGSALHRDAIVSAGGIPALVSALDSCRGDAGIAAMVCEVLCAFCLSSDAWNAAVVAAHGVPAIGAALDVLRERETVVVASVALAAVFHGFRGDDDAIVTSHDIHTVVAALAAHGGDAVVATAGCTALALMCDSNMPNAYVRCDAMGDAGGIPVVIATLETFGGHAAVVAFACWALAVVFGKGYIYGEAAVATRGIAAVVLALEAQHDVKIVSMAACKALMNIAAANDTLRDAVVAARGVPCIIAAILAHPGDTDVIEMACGALSSICATSDAHRDAIVAERGVAAVVTALDASRSDAAVASAACTLLRDICAGSDVHRNAVVAAHGVPAIVVALEVHRNVAAVAVSACLALRKVCCGTDAHRDAVDTARGVSAVVAVLGEHRGDADVAAAACRALCNMCTSLHAHRDAVVAAGGIPALISALEAHGGDAAVAAAACDALRNICVASDAHRNAIVTSRGVAAVVSALSTCRVDATVAAAACAALRNVCVSSDSHRAAVVSARALPVIATVLGGHRGDAAVAAAACGALVNVAWNAGAARNAVTVTWNTVREAELPTLTAIGGDAARLALQLDGLVRRT